MNIWIFPDEKLIIVALNKFIWRKKQQTPMQTRPGGRGRRQEVAIRGRGRGWSLTSGVKGGSMSLTAEFKSLETVRPQDESSAPQEPEWC